MRSKTNINSNLLFFFYRLESTDYETKRINR